MWSPALPQSLWGLWGFRFLTSLVWEPLQALNNSGSSGLFGITKTHEVPGMCEAPQRSSSSSLEGKSHTDKGPYTKPTATCCKPPVLYLSELGRGKESQKASEVALGLVSKKSRAAGSCD